MAKKIGPGELGEIDSDTLIDVIDADTEPMIHLKQAAEKVGLQAEVVKRLVARLRPKYMEVRREGRAVKTQELVHKLETVADSALDYMDDYALANSSAKDLAIIVGIMLEKRNLMRGEPTHILSTTERSSLDELVPQLLKEAQRRGIELVSNEDGIYTMPPTPEAQARPRSSGMNLNEKLKKSNIDKRAATGEPE